MWSDSAAAMRRLDALVRAGRITGWGFEPSVDYLGAQQPTMSYRMYRGNDEQDANLGAFVREISQDGALIAVSEAQGCVGTGTGTGPGTGLYIDWRPPAASAARRGVWRSRQVVLTVSFASERQLCRAAELIAERFTRRTGSGHRPGSWWVPDARVSGTANCPPGMVPARAHTRPTSDGHLVVLSASGPAPFPLARSHRLFLPRPFGDFLRG